MKGTWRSIESLRALGFWQVASPPKVQTDAITCITSLLRGWYTCNKMVCCVEFNLYSTLSRFTMPADYCKKVKVGHLFVSIYWVQNWKVLHISSQYTKPFHHVFEFGKYKTVLCTHKFSPHLVTSKMSISSSLPPVLAEEVILLVLCVCLSVCLLVCPHAETIMYGLVIYTQVDGRCAPHWTSLHP